MPRNNLVHMATYKKRGYKPKDKVEKIEEHSATAEVFKSLDEGASKTEDWVAANQKYIFVIVGLVAVAVLGYLGYNKFVAEPARQEAMNDMFKAQSYFNDAVNAPVKDKDSLFNLALQGAGGKFGLLNVIEEHSGTPAANLANYYAGMAFLNTKKYKEAIEYLSDYSAEDEVTGVIAKGAIGDAFMQLNQPKDALGYYKQAATMRDNEFTTPMYLFKAGTTALQLGEASKALDYFNKIKLEYPKSTQATDVEVYIGKAEALK